MGVGVVEFYTSTRHHVHAFFRFNDEDRCSRSSFFTFPFCLSLSRRECAPRYAAPIGRLLLLLPHRRESGHTVSFVHQVSLENYRRIREEDSIWKFRRRNPNCGATLNISDPYSLRRSNFNDRYPTVIFIHGYSESATGRSAVTIRDGTVTVIFNYNSYIIIIGYYRSSILKEKRQERNVCSSVKSNSPRLRKSV